MRGPALSPHRQARLDALWLPDTALCANTALLLKTRTNQNRPLLPPAGRVVAKKRLSPLMHPRLSLENTPACVEEIKALQACHADTNYWIKLLGACNEKKMVLDKCFRAQKKVRGWTMLEMSQHASSRARLMMAGQTKG